MTKLVDSDCQAFQLAVTVLSRPWTGVILTVLQGGPLRFSEIAERGHGIGDKVLSARLKDLEARALILRHVDLGPPVRVAYELTDNGRGFRHVAEAIERWGINLVADEKQQQRRRRAG